MKLAGTVKSKKRNKVTYFIKSQQKYLFRFFLLTVPANFMPLAMQVRPKLKNSLTREFLEVGDMSAYMLLNALRWRLRRKK